LQISNKIEGEIRITVVDTKGHTVYSRLIMNNVDDTIDCSQFNSGVYFVNIAFKDGVKNI